MKKSIFCSSLLLIGFLVATSSFAQAPASSAPASKPAAAAKSTSAASPANTASDSVQQDANQGASVVEQIRTLAKKQIGELEEKNKTLTTERDNAVKSEGATAKKLEKVQAAFDKLMASINAANNDAELAGKLQPDKKGTAMPQVIGNSAVDQRGQPYKPTPTVAENNGE